MKLVEYFKANSVILFITRDGEGLIREKSSLSLGNL